MKKLIALLIVVLCLNICSCRGRKSESVPNISPESQSEGALEEVPQLDPNSEPAESDSGTETNAIRPEIKDFLDAYEEFMDVYIDFMKSYMSASMSEKIQMMAKYTDLLTKYTEYMEKVEELDDNDLNESEIIYYLEVTSRVTKKLTENLL